MSFWRVFVIFFVSYSTILFLFIKIEVDGISMLPTIQDKSFVFAKKYYPFLSKVNRGDIISFSVKEDETDYIKRVIGIPGDTVQLQNGQLIINNETIPKVSASEMNEFTETLNNGQSYNVGIDGGNYQVKQLAEVAAKVVPGCELIFTGEQSNDPRSYKVSFKKIFNRLFHI